MVIFTEQWESTREHTPALIGLLATALCLLLFGSQNFILAAMVLIFLLLTLLRGKLQGGDGK